MNLINRIINRSLIIYKFKISKYSYINNNNFGFQNLFIYEMPNF